MSSHETEFLNVEVVYALPEHAEVRTLRVARGSTVAAALRASGIAEVLAGVDMAAMPVACFGHRVAVSRLVEEGDRLELLRPLQVDPREARRARRRQR